MFPKKFFIRNIHSGAFLELFLISAVATILVIRFFLQLTNYPQIGGGNLHIAHMLWGGLLMLFSIVFLIVFINHSIKTVGAILGGVGFGTFIDELGKFITHDNNYFFDPTIALIYLTFIILFLIFRALESQRQISPQEYLDNAFDLTRSVVVEAGGAKEKEDALKYIQNSGLTGGMVDNLKSLLSSVQTEYREGWLTRLNNKFKNLFKFLLVHKWFLYGIIGFFGLYSVVDFINAAKVASLYFILEGFSLSFVEIGKFASSIISGVIIIVGLIVLLRSREKALKIIRLGVLFSVFITQFFDFYDNDLGALGGLVTNIVILFVLQYIINLSIDNYSTTTLDLNRDS